MLTAFLAWFEHVPTAAWIYGWFAAAFMVLLVVSAMMVAGARADERGAELTTRRRAWDRMDR